MNRPIERAAGGMVVRGDKLRREVLVIDDAYGKVTFPKGHLEQGETWEDAAVREIREETGVEARILAPLGRIEYPVEKAGQTVRKQVRLFLLEAVDEAAAPTHQEEEVKAAYFLPMDDARQAHDANGYANWGFLFAKAAALLEWHDSNFERDWRQVHPDDDGVSVDDAFARARPTVESLIRACRDELAHCLPEAQLPPESGTSYPLANPDATAVRNAVEHTLLKPEASLVDIENLCREADAAAFACVCVHGRFVSHAAHMLSQSATDVCTVLAFPHGAVSPRELTDGVQSRAREGASEIDMVIPVGAMVEDDIWTVMEHVSTAVQVARELDPKPLVKVILENSALTLDQTIKASLVAIAAGADFIKTSTGFSGGGAQLADVHAMACVAGTKARVKAAGGIRSAKAARDMMRFGASRLGTSSGLRLLW